MSASCCCLPVVGGGSVEPPPTFAPALYAGFQGIEGGGIQYTAVEVFHDMIGGGRPIDDPQNQIQNGITRGGASDFTFAAVGTYMFHMQSGWNSLGGRITVRCRSTTQGTLGKQTSAAVATQRGWVLATFPFVTVVPNELIFVEYTTTIVSGILTQGSIAGSQDRLAQWHFIRVA